MGRKITRRDFLKTSTVALGAVALSSFPGTNSVFAAGEDKSHVFFTTDLNASGLLNIYSKINQYITGKTAIKLHTGEPHGPNILPREMVKALQQNIPNSNLVETNTLYNGWLRRFDEEYSHRLRGRGNRQKNGSCSP